MGKWKVVGGSVVGILIKPAPESMEIKGYHCFLYRNFT